MYLIRVMSLCESVLVTAYLHVSRVLPGYYGRLVGTRVVTSLLMMLDTFRLILGHSKSAPSRYGSKQQVQ